MSKRGSNNFGVTSCNVLNSTENIKSNTGFYLLLVILAIFIIVFIIFCSKGYIIYFENKGLFKYFNIYIFLLKLI